MKAINVFALIFSFLAFAAALASLALQLYNPKRPQVIYRYFATSEVGELLQMSPPLDEKGEQNDNKSIQEWMTFVLNSTLNLNATNYRQQLIAANQHYTKRGWQSFTVWMHQNSVIDKLEASKDHSGFLRCVFLRDFSISDEGVVGGRYQWTITGKVELSDSETSKNYDLEAVIVRSPRLESLNGISIEKIGLTPAS